MASVTGLTADKMYQIQNELTDRTNQVENKSIVGGSVVAGDLILKNYAGQEINAGYVKGDPGPTGAPLFRQTMPFLSSVEDSASGVLQTMPYELNSGVAPLAVVTLLANLAGTPNPGIIELVRITAQFSTFSQAIAKERHSISLTREDYDYFSTSFVIPLPLIETTEVVTAYVSFEVLTGGSPMSFYNVSPIPEFENSLIGVTFIASNLEGSGSGYYPI